jgi:drug/metabolite transporter (DMT)-like permease
MPSPALLLFSIPVSTSYAAPVPDTPQAAAAPPALTAVPGLHVSAPDAAGGAPPRGRLDRLPPQSFFRGALPAFRHPVLLLAGAGVGVCSSVIPYVTDQLAMARLPRATFSLMLALLPVFATVIGAIVLRQLPTGEDVAGITLVVAGVALHQQTHREGT